MTFDEIVAMVATDLNITQPLSITRIGTHVNRRYRKVLRRLGLVVFSRVEFDFECTPGTATQTVSAQSDAMDAPTITRIINIYHEQSPTARPRKLDEVPYETMKEMLPTEDIPTHWATKRKGSETQTFVINSTIPDGLTLILECEESKSTLAGDDIPNFNEEFHEILATGAKADELLKLEKPNLSRVFKDQFDEELNELALKAVISSSMDIIQNAKASRRFIRRR